MVERGQLVGQSVAPAELSVRQRIPLDHTVVDPRLRGSFSTEQDTCGRRRARTPKGAASCGFGHRGPSCRGRRHSDDQRRARWSAWSSVPAERAAVSSTSRRDLLTPTALLAHLLYHVLTRKREVGRPSGVRAHAGAFTYSSLVTATAETSTARRLRLERMHRARTASGARASSPRGPRSPRGLRAADCVNIFATAPPPSPLGRLAEGPSASRSRAGASALQLRRLLRKPPGGCDSSQQGCEADNRPPTPGRGRLLVERGPVRETRPCVPRLARSSPACPCSSAGDVLTVG